MAQTHGEAPPKGGSSNYPALVVVVTMLGVGVSITVPYLSLFGTSVIHMNPLELGVFMFLNSLGGIFASSWLGKASVHRPKKDIILFSSFSAAIGYGLFSMIHSYWVLVLTAILFLGMGSSAFPQIFAYAKEALMDAKYRDATFALSALRSFFSLAWVVGPLIGAGAMAQLGFSGMFRVTSVTFLLVLILVFVFLRRRHPNTSAVAGHFSVVTILKRREVFFSSIAFVAIFCASSSNGLYMPLLVTKTLHAPNHVVGWVASLSAGLEIPIMLLVGAASSKMGNRKLILMGIVSGTCYYFGMTMVQAVWQVLTIQFLGAIYIAVIMSIGMSYFQDFSPDAAGISTTLYNNTNQLGSMLGSLLGGTVAQLLGLRDVYWFSVVLTVFAFIFLFAQKPEALSRPNHVSASMQHKQVES